MSYYRISQWFTNEIIISFNSNRCYSFLRNFLFNWFKIDVHIKHYLIWEFQSLGKFYRTTVILRKTIKEKLDTVIVIECTELIRFIKSTFNVVSSMVTETELIPRMMHGKIYVKLLCNWNSRLLFHRLFPFLCTAYSTWSIYYTCWSFSLLHEFAHKTSSGFNFFHVFSIRIPFP